MIQSDPWGASSDAILSLCKEMDVQDPIECILKVKELVSNIDEGKEGK